MLLQPGDDLRYPLGPDAVPGEPGLHAELLEELSGLRYRGLDLLVVAAGLDAPDPLGVLDQLRPLPLPPDVEQGRQDYRQGLAVVYAQSVCLLYEPGFDSREGLRLHLLPELREGLPPAPEGIRVHEGRIRDLR